MASRDALCSCGQLHLTVEGEKRTFHFCPDRGATLFCTPSTMPGFIAVPIGAFAEPGFPPPTVSIHESRQHPWLALTTAMEHHD